MPEQQPRGQPRDAEAAVGAYAPLLREMMLSTDEKKKYGVPPASWWLFTSTKVRNPHVPPNARCVAAADFSYLTDIRAQFERWRQAPQPIHGWRGVRRVGHGPVRAQGRPVRPQVEVCKTDHSVDAAAENDRYEDLCGCVLITGGAGGGKAPDRLFTTLLPQLFCRYRVAVGVGTDDPRKSKCYACDVCDQDDVKRVCDSIEDLVGVIHCAGVTYGGPFTNENDSKLLFDIKYWGTRYTPQSDAIS